MSNKVPYNPLEHPTPERPVEILEIPDGTMESVSIVIVHHNRPEYLNILIQSIYNMSNLYNFEVIVVDNASTQESQEYLDVLEAEGVKVVRCEDNFFWSAAANKGAAVASKTSKYLIFMHADTVVLNNAWIDIMVNLSQSKGFGIVGTQLQTYYVNKQKADYIQEWCMLITRECWNDCGPWPEELPLIGNAFILCIRAQFKGYRPSSMNNALVHHYRAISYDPNTHDRMSEAAYALIPKLMQQAQNYSR
jgi:GT2 family glycosyltransferase